MKTFDEIAREAYKEFDGGFTFEEYLAIAKAPWSRAQRHISHAKPLPFRMPLLGVFMPMPNRSLQALSRKLKRIEQGKQVDKNLEESVNLIQMALENFPEKIEIIQQKLENADPKTRRIIESRLPLLGKSKP